MVHLEPWVSSLGFWPRVWHDQDVDEMGWSVLPAFQGRGMAAAGTAGGRRGFELVAACDFECPPGHVMRCNDWRLDLG